MDGIYQKEEETSVTAHISAHTSGLSYVELDYILFLPVLFLLNILDSFNPRCFELKFGTQLKIKGQFVWTMHTIVYLHCIIVTVTVHNSLQFLISADYIEKKASSLGLEELFLLTTRTADWLVSTN